MTHGYRVHLPMFDLAGNVLGGRSTMYVATEERAREIASGHPMRSFERVAIEEIPEVSRANLLRAHAARQAADAR